LIDNAQIEDLEEEVHVFQEKEIKAISHSQKKSNVLTTQDDPIE
jgi:hypothetical protein